MIKATTKWTLSFSRFRFSQNHRIGIPRDLQRKLCLPRAYKIYRKRKMPPTSFLGLSGCFRLLTTLKVANHRKKSETKLIFLRGKLACLHHGILQWKITDGTQAITRWRTHDAHFKRSIAARWPKNQIFLVSSKQKRYHLELLLKVTGKVLCWYLI